MNMVTKTRFILKNINCNVSIDVYFKKMLRGQILDYYWKTNI